MIDQNHVSKNKGSYGIKKGGLDLKFKDLGEIPFFSYLFVSEPQLS